MTSILGTNLTTSSSANPGMHFLNIMKSGSGWGQLGGALSNADLYNNYLDANGYPTSMPPGTTVIGMRQLFTPVYLTAGNYVFLYDGVGTFTFDNDYVSTVSSAAGRIVFTLSGAGSGTSVLIHSTGTTNGAPDYAHNMRLVYSPGSDGSTVGAREQLLLDGEIFDPYFLATLAPFKILRFVEWMAYGNNFQKDWTDRPKLSWVCWGDSPTNASLRGADGQSTGSINDGVPAEVMFALCNKMNAHGWFNMPALSTDDYVTQFATLAHSSLNSNLRAYVEHHNEVWINANAADSTGSEPYNVIQLMSLNDLAQFPALRSAAFTGSITSNVLTVTSVASGTIGVSGNATTLAGDYVYGKSGSAGTPWNCYITSAGTGTGGVGTYNLDSCPNIASTSFQSTQYSTTQINDHYTRFRALRQRQLWRAAWGGDASRAICMWGGQHSNIDKTTGTLDQLASDYVPGLTGNISANVDAICIAPYFGAASSYSYTSSTTATQVFQQLDSGGVINVDADIDVEIDSSYGLIAHIAAAAARGLPINCYESGQTLATNNGATVEALIRSVNRDARMQTSYTTYYNKIRAAYSGQTGEQVVNHYSDIYTYNGKNNWGALEDITQPLSGVGTPPKYAALVGISAIWNGTAAPAPAPAPIIRVFHGHSNMLVKKR